MNRHSLLLAAAAAASALSASSSSGQEAARDVALRGGDGPVQDDRPTGTFYVSAPVRVSEARVVARVEKRFGTARLLHSRTVYGRRGAHVAYVFAIPKALAGGGASLGRSIAGVARSVSAAGAEILMKQAVDGSLGPVGGLLSAGAKKDGKGKADAEDRAKGKPITMPLFDSDLNSRSVHEQAAMHQTNAFAAQQKARGAGKTVAVLDGGWDLRHEFLADHVYGGYDALDGDSNPEDLGNLVDDDGDGGTDRCVGHGNFVASIILAVAPDAVILPIRVLDDESWGNDLSVASGISYAVDHGAAVINLSLVLPNATQIVKDAVAYAQNQGVVIVSAAGTTDDGWQNDPAIRDRAICVGAVDAEDVIAEWSLADKAVNVFAPGVEPVGAIGGLERPNSYGRWSGVSFATPFLAGGAALIRENHPWPQWPISYVKNRLTGTADPVYDGPDDVHKKSGRVDLDGAVVR